MPHTPPWQVDDWTLTAGFGKIEQQWDPIREIVGDARLFDLRDPTVSGWSCGEQAGHMTLVALWIAQGIDANLADPQRDADGDWAERARPILEGGEFPRGVAQAPPRVNTLGRRRDEFEPILATAMEAWAGVQGRLGELPECPARFQHFALGYLTTTDWVRFCPIHTAHHLRIVRDIRGGTAG